MLRFAWMSANVTASAVRQGEEILQLSRSAWQCGIRTHHLGLGHEDPPSVCDWPHADGWCPWLGSSVSLLHSPLHGEGIIFSGHWYKLTQILTKCPLSVAGCLQGCLLGRP